MSYVVLRYSHIVLYLTTTPYDFTGIKRGLVSKMKLKKIGIALGVASLAGIISACNDGEASTKDETGSAASAPLPVEIVMPVKAEIFATYHTTTTLVVRCRCARAGPGRGRGCPDSC